MPSIGAVATVFFCAQMIKRQTWLTNHLLRHLRAIRKRRSTGYRRARDQPCPGRCVSLAGFKRPYRTDRLTGRYEKMLQNATWFNVAVHMSNDDFVALHELVKPEIDTPLDTSNNLTPSQRLTMRKKRKKLSSQELLFLYLEVLSGGMCGAHAIVNMSSKYGVCNATIWNYIYHTGWACYRALSQREPITWPTAQERKAMTGLIRGFPDVVMFVDGTRRPIFKSLDEDIQNDQYFGNDKIHCYAVLIYVDIFGLIRRVEVSYSGRLHDKTMFQLSDVYLKRGEYFSENEKMMCDAGFIGAGEKDWIIVPFKKGTGLFFELRKEWNRDVRQRFGNEMAIGYIKNRNRTFRGWWPYAEELFTASIKTAAMIMNWKLKRNAMQIVPIERMISRMSVEERLLFASSSCS